MRKFTVLEHITLDGVIQAGAGRTRIRATALRMEDKADPRNHTNLHEEDTNPASRFLQEAL